MKFSISALLAALAAPAVLVAGEDHFPSQTFIIPINEDMVLKSTFDLINVEAEGPVQSYTSIAVGVTGTVIWFDHHEDGYESKPTEDGANIEVWGDNDPSNGMAPGYTTDYFNAGDVIVLQSSTALEQLPWVEDFEGITTTNAQGVVLDRGATSFKAVRNGGSFKVHGSDGSKYLACNQSGGEARMDTGMIDVSGTTSVDIAVDVSESGGMESNDYLKLYAVYREGGPGNSETWNLIGQKTGNFSPTTLSKTISTTNIDYMKIVLKSDVTWTDEYMKVHSISVTSTNMGVSKFALPYDGGDKIMASRDIAVTRGCYPSIKSGSTGDKGSMLAGAVEVLDMSFWGTEFEAPVGQDLSTSQNAFQHVQLYVMAGQDGTVVTVEGAVEGTETVTLDAGESAEIKVNMGAKLTTNGKKVQVDLLAGDVHSTYEMRWFSLLPTASWSTSYLSPVGNTQAQVTAWVYQPADATSDLTVTYHEFGTSAKTVTVPPGTAVSTQVLDDQRGTFFEASDKFIVFVIIDAAGSGQIYDWGFPVAPADTLTGQVLVGWGDGCTNDDCNGGNQRSEVWISPTADAVCSVSFEGDGVKSDFQISNADGDVIDTVSSVQLSKWESTTIWDHTDQDMTGAMVYCDDSDGNPVPFAAVWGQNPERSFSGDDFALDLGTLIPPYPCTRTEKFACLVGDDGNGVMDPTDSCTISTVVSDNCGGETTTVTVTDVCGDPSQYSLVEVCLPPETTTTTTTTEATTTTTEATTTTTEATTTTTEATTTTTTTDQWMDGSKEGGGGGDPHFQRWDQAHSTFHGECDLVMIHSDEFHNKAGLDLHVRTTIQDYFSYIEKAALRVGENVLEIQEDGFLLNSVKLTSDDLPVTFGGDFKYTISKAPVEAGKNPKFYQYYKVDLHEDSTILFKFYKKFLTISVSGHSSDFADSTGLLGEFHTGAMLDRDGSEIHSFQEFGFEWQVSPSDPKIFSEARSPQLPFEQCRLPTAPRTTRRALRGKALQLMQAAQTACAHVNGSDFELCTEDVMMTEDLGLAALW